MRCKTFLFDALGLERKNKHRPARTPAVFFCGCVALATFVFSLGRFSMRLQFSVTICLSFFTAGWYVVTKVVSLPCFVFAVVEPMVLSQR